MVKLASLIFDLVTKNLPEKSIGVDLQRYLICCCNRS